MFLQSGLVLKQQILESQITFQNSHSETISPLSVEQQSLPTGFLFSNQNSKGEVQRDVKLLLDRIIVSDFSYTGFDSFMERMNDWGKSMEKILGSRCVNKVGLRKISSIFIKSVYSTKELCTMFHPSLFASIRSGLIHFDALVLNEEVLVLQKDESLSVLRNRIKKQDHELNSFEANLDFDILIHKEHKLEETLNEILPQMNADHFDLFMWAVTDEMIHLMEKEPHHVD